MGNAKKDFQKYAELESKQEQVIVDITNNLNRANNRLEEIRKLKRDAGIRYYTSEKRKKTIERVKQIGYSREDIKKMELYLADEHWNQDEIDGVILDLFQNAEGFIENSETFPQKLQSFFSSLGKLVDDGEGNQNDN